MSASGGGSGSPVYFTVGAGGACAVSGTNGATLTLTGAGSCSVSAHQDGTADYQKAADVSQTFQILQAAQSISFGPLPTAYLGDAAVALAATGGGSGNPVTFSAGPSSVRSTTPSGPVTLIGPGTCSVTANQAGNTNYTPAAPITRTFAVSYRTCVLSDTSHASPAGGVVPVKLTLCNQAGQPFASPSVVLHAVSVDGGPVKAPGNSQPGNNFRYVGGAYQYNLDTSGLAAGSHRLYFSVGGDPSTHYVVVVLS